MSLYNACHCGLFQWTERGCWWRDPNSPHKNCSQPYRPDAGLKTLKLKQETKSSLVFLYLCLWMCNKIVICHVFELTHFVLYSFGWTFEVNKQVSIFRHRKASTYTLSHYDVWKCESDWPNKSVCYFYITLQVINAWQWHQVLYHFLKPTKYWKERYRYVMKHILVLSKSLQVHLKKNRISWKGQYFLSLISESETHILYRFITHRVKYLKPLFLEILMMVYRQWKPKIQCLWKLEYYIRSIKKRIF